MAGDDKIDEAAEGGVVPANVQRAAGLPPSEPISHILDTLLTERRDHLEGLIRRGLVPSANDLASVERLGRMKALQTAAEQRRRAQITYVSIVLGCVIALVLLFLRHVDATYIELDVKLARFSFELRPNTSKHPLVPGEWGEVVQLVAASVSGVERVDPPDDVAAGTLQWSMPAADSSALSAAARSVKLQRLQLPDASVTLTAQVAYGFGQRGLELDAVSQQPVTAAFARLLGVPDDSVPPKLDYVLQPVAVSGTRMRSTLFPLDAVHALTILRGSEIARFDLADIHGSTILSGTLTVEGRRAGVETLMPGDSIALVADGDAFVRELTYQDDGIHLRMSIHATEAKVGHAKLRNVMPTWFDEILSRWSNELYSAVIALIGLLLAIVRWWRS